MNAHVFTVMLAALCAHTTKGKNTEVQFEMKIIDKHFNTYHYSNHSNMEIVCNMETPLLK